MIRNRPTYVVMNEHTLGYIYVRQPGQVNVLHGSILRGYIGNGYGPSMINPGDALRLATETDFRDYRVLPPRNFPEDPS